MPSLRLALAASACLSLVSAFPAVQQFAKRQVEVDTPFNAAKQLVSVTGQHAFSPPGKGDTRSPCPALNQLANHNYIPHSGYTTLLQMTEALETVYGVSPDLAGALTAILLTSQDGKGDTYNIGGFPSTQTGFGAYQYQGLSLMGTIEGPNVIKTICDRFAATNGSQYHTADPVSSAGPGIDFLFFRLMGNKSAEFPDGSFGASSELPHLAETPNGDGTFTWAQYHNRIPTNWYTRNALDPYTSAFLASDIAQVAAYSGFQGLQGNYNGYNMKLLTNGAYSNEDLEDSTTNVCFLTQAVPIVLPALAKLPAVSDSMRQNIATAASDFTKGVASIQCSKTMTSMDMPLLSSIIGIAGLV